MIQCFPNQAGFSSCPQGVVITLMRHFTLPFAPTACTAPLQYLFYFHLKHDVTLLEKPLKRAFVVKPVLEHTVHEMKT